MDIVIVTPCHVPLMIGGSEKLWWGLLDHLNRRTEHHADIVKLPGPEGDFWEVVDSYRAFSELDMRPYDVIISGKYPGWMVDHPSHVCYYQHPLRGLYDTYPGTALSRGEFDHPDVRRLIALFHNGDYSRDALRECFARIERLRAPRRGWMRRPVSEAAFAFPGPLIREIVHFCDRVAFRRGAVRRLCAISETVSRREGCFPPGTEVVPLYPPSNLGGYRAPRDGHYLFTVSRLDRPKRIDLLIEAMRYVPGDTQLWIAGTGPDEERLRAFAAADARIRFLGFVNDERLLDLYAEAMAVLFIPKEEDFGLVTLEAMHAGKPVITTEDAGGTREFVRDGVTGYVTEPSSEAIARRIGELVAEPQLAKRMGEIATSRASQVTWEHVCEVLLDGLDS
jgi:glycosyltransferase involved in cell wall biosynthesis